MARKLQRHVAPIPKDDGAKPLEPPELEAFVRAFRDSFDGPAAARAADYEENTDTIWQELLRRADVQARLRHYRAGIDAPARSASAVLDHLFARAFTDISSLIAVNPVTGLAEYDLSAATPAQLAALEIEQTISETGGKLKRTTRIRPRPIGPDLLTIARRLGLDEPVPEAGEDRLAAALREINQRGSAAPIASERVNANGMRGT